MYDAEAADHAVGGSVICKAGGVRTPGFRAFLPGEVP
jgi:hypothetical protein